MGAWEIVGDDNVERCHSEHVRCGVPADLDSQQLVCRRGAHVPSNTADSAAGARAYMEARNSIARAWSSQEACLKIIIAQHSTLFVDRYAHMWLADGRLENS